MPSTEDRAIDHQRPADADLAGQVQEGQPAERTERVGLRPGAESGLVVQPDRDLGGLRVGVELPDDVNIPPPQVGG